MAQHDGSFLSMLPVDTLIASDCQSSNSAISELPVSDSHLPVSNSQELIVSNSDLIVPSLDLPVSSSDVCVSSSGLPLSTSKRRHRGYDKGADNHGKVRAAAPIISPPAFTCKPNVADSYTVSELGILGYLSDDDELVNIFPTPSPQELRTKTAFKICSGVGSSNNKAQVNSLPEESGICNVALTHFDSPEEHCRGWSELGLRIRRAPRPLPEHQQKNGPAYFDLLADEVIFDESLWKCIDASKKLLPPGALGDCIVNRGCHTFRLSNTVITGPLYINTKPKPSKLQYLDLSMASISMSALNSLLSNCSNLRKLSLENLPISEQTCRAISVNVELTTLNLAMTEGLTYHGLSHIFTGCKRLDELNIAWVKLSKDDVMSTVTALPDHLLRLNMSGCRRNITDAEVEVLVNACPNLLELDLSDSLGVTELSVEYICSCLPLIQSLHLSRCYFILPQSLVQVRRLAYLTTLSIFSMMEEENLTALVKSLSAYPITINSQPFSYIARPTVGICRTSIWGHRVRDIPV